MTVRRNMALEDAKKQEPDSTSLTYLQTVITEKAGLELGGITGQ